LFGQVHQLTVDAYAVQHAGGRHPDKSLTIHLAGLYLMIEHRVRPPSVPGLFQILAANVSRWPHLEPPDPVRSITVWDVVLAGPDERHAATVRAWARSVWDGWSIHHGEIAILVAAYLNVAALPILDR